LAELVSNPCGLRVVDAAITFDGLVIIRSGIRCGSEVHQAKCHADAAHRIDHARKLGEQLVASGFDDPPTVLGNLRAEP
jgi:hypothetical protein